jgi:lipopolysaccharide transport system ATP-binding protein
MSEVAHGGRTVLFVSHNMNAIEQLCGSAILLEQGKLTDYSNDVRHVITRYLSSGVNDESRVEWLNTGGEYENPYFKPLRLFVSDKDGNVINHAVSRGDEVWIQIEGEIQKMDSTLSVGYAIYGESGVQLFLSMHTDGSEAEWAKLHEGKCLLRSKLPLHLLNEGAHRIECIVDLHNVRWVLLPGEHNPTVRIDVQGGLSDSPYWTRTRIGVIAPVLAWEAANVN